MTPPTSTPSHKKRVPTITSESSSRQVSVKKPRTTSTNDTEATERTPVSSEPAAVLASLVQSNNTHSLAQMETARPEHNAVPIYEPNPQTIFLADDFNTVHWKPIQSPQKHAVKISKHIHRYGNDIHSYFISEAAGRNAAAFNGPISPYRHVGHVILHSFQQLNSLPDNINWIPSLNDSTVKYVNMRNIIIRGRCENGALVKSLDSLANPEPTPWPAPLVVLISNREDVLRTANNGTGVGFDLTIQVYVGRLLFELISNMHIRALFTVLRPTVPYKAIPLFLTSNPTFARSPVSSQDGFGNTFANVLRDAESLGYDDLTPTTRLKIHSTLTVGLYRHQEQTVRWMLDKENSPYVLNDYFWEERSFTDTPHCKQSKFYYFPMTGEVRLLKPPSMRGGMIAEETGLGKTAEALALIAAQKSDQPPEEIEVLCEKRPTHISVKDGIAYLSRQRIRNLERSPSQLSDFHHGDEIIDERETFDFPTNVRIRRWPAKTTLIVCPKDLVGQWKQEALKLAPSLSLEVWSSGTKKNRGSPLSVAVGENAKDIVVATYDMIRNDATLSKICWRRLILDESQVARRSAAQVSNDILNLRCNTRFLMTGTPLVNSINDLKGQLAFLKVWPFCLEQDGFWNTFINYPFRCGCPIPILKTLVHVTMIRHSRAQQLNIFLPPQSYETIKVPLRGSYRACYYFILATSLEELDAQARQCANPRRMRTLLKLLLMLCISPYLLEIASLDEIRRSAFAESGVNPTPQISQAIRKVSAQEAIQFMAESSPGPAPNSERDLVLQPGVIATGVDTFMKLPITELQNLIVSRKLLTRVRALRTSRERLAAIAAGGIHRLDSDSLAQLRKTAMDLGLGSVEEVSAWSRDKAFSKLKLHYDSESEKRVIGSVHESGLSAILKLIEKRENPNCPVCLTDCDGRIVATKCGHLYCYGCLTSLLRPRTGFSERCAICRRDLSPDMAVEILRDESATQSNMKAEESSNDKIVSLLDERVSKGPSLTLSLSALFDVAEMGQTSDHDDSASQDLSAARNVWREFEKIDPDLPDYNSIGRDDRFPSLPPEFLRHLLVARRGRSMPPKFAALRMLVLSNAPSVKFCVVAGSVQSLREIANFLTSEGIDCVGVGTTSDSSTMNNYDLSTAAERFSNDSSVRVFLLNPSNATGLTLTAASVVVFMETLLRVADEVQAITRVHRMGQTRPVKIVRILAKNTLEEKLFECRGQVEGDVEVSQALSAAMDSEALDVFISRLFGR